VQDAVIPPLEYLALVHSHPYAVNTVRHFQLHHFKSTLVSGAPTQQHGARTLRRHNRGTTHLMVELTGMCDNVVRHRFALNSVNGEEPGFEVRQCGTGRVRTWLIGRVPSGRKWGG
jgi:hypothetical protein